MSYEKIEIGRLVALRQGFAINKKTNHHISDEPTNLHLLRIGDMKDGNFSIFVKNTIPEKFIAKESDIIFTRTGQVGLVFRKQYGVVHNNCFTVTTIDEDILLQEFIYYALQEKSFYEEAVSRATGAAQPDLSHGAFNSIQIYLPTIESQRKITNILNAYDILIENNKKQIKLLEESAQRIYKEWFIDLHFPGYENTEIIDGVPEGWERAPLTEFADVTMGQSPKSEFFNQDGMGLPFHQGVGSYGFRFVIDETFSTSYTKIAEANSILFSVRAPVGRLNITMNKIVIGRGIAAINSKQGYQSFLFYMLKEKFYKEDILGNGSIFSSITKKELLKLQFVIPVFELIEKYEKIVEPIDKDIVVLNKKVQGLKEARDRLLPKLISGEIEV